MGTPLPTIQAEKVSITGFRDAMLEAMAGDKTGEGQLRMYFYGVTEAGWREVTESVEKWLKGGDKRKAIVYVGTDDGLTKPKALSDMKLSGAEVRLMVRYNGTFHPKVVWLRGTKNTLLVGSNNLTLDALKSNIEFATSIQFAKVDNNLSEWHDAVHDASDLLTSKLLNSYKREVNAFKAKRSKNKSAGRFTWSKKEGAPRKTSTSKTGAKSKNLLGGGLDGRSLDGLILEVMPRETSNDGSQVQIPLKAASSLFQLPKMPNASINVFLTNLENNDRRQLTMTRYKNKTARLTIKELDFTDRPCLIFFTKKSSSEFDFQLIKEAIVPRIYRDSIKQCPQKQNRRRWKLVDAGTL